MNIVRTRIEAVEKAKREKAERRATQIAALKGEISKSFTTLQLALPKAKLSITVAGVIGIIFLLFWVGSWAMPTLFSPAPTAQASITPGSIATITSSNSPIPFTQTGEPSKTPTATPKPLTFSVYDDFSSSSSTGVFDTALWSTYSEQGTISSQNGYLVFSATEGSYALNAITPPIWRIDQIGRLQADLRIDSVGEEYGSLSITMISILPNEQGSLLVSSSVGSVPRKSPEFISSFYLLHSDATDIDDFYASDPIPIEFGKFYTIAIEIAPDASYVRYLVNGMIIGEYQPKEKILLTEADFEWSIGAYKADGALDNVAVGKIE